MYRRGNRHGQPVTLVISELNESGEVCRFALPRSVGVKQKDTKPKSAKSLNYFEPVYSLVDFSKIVDDEDITQEDL